MKSASLFAAACAAVLAAGPLSAQAPPAISLSRMQCGTNAAPTDVGLRFSDTYAYSGLKVQLTFSCYLIRHGDDYMIWDTGNSTTAGAAAPKSTLVELLTQLKLTPEQIKYVAISHYHGDHTGQAALFPHSTLLIGKGDWDALNDRQVGD